MRLRGNHMRVYGILGCVVILAMLAAACGGGPRGWLACEPWTPADSESGIYVFEATTCQVRQLTTGRPNSDQAWSPDGRAIAYSRRPESGPGNVDIYVSDLEGNVTQITSTPGELEFGPVWSPAGDALAFTSGPLLPQGGDRDVFVVDLAGGKRTNLTNTPHRSERSLAWSPDGTRIAFAGERSNGNEALPFEVSIVDASRSSQSVTVAKELRDFAFSWSPSGSRLAIAAVGRSGLLLLSEGDGSVVFTLAEDARATVKPVWSPDGRWIAYACASPQPPAPYRLCVVRADGDATVNTQQPLTSDPVWSPDSKTVVFAAEREILEWDIVRGRVKEVALIIGAEALTFVSGGQLAFYERTGHCFLELRILNLQGGDEGLLLQDVYPTAVWSPDRSRLVYAAFGSVCF